MNTKLQIPAIAAMTLAAVMSTSLIACSDSTSASNDEQPTSSANPESSASVPESSDALVSSSSTNENFEGACESEGEVKTGWSGNNPKYGSDIFYRCEQGTWIERGAWVKCDTAGVAVGSICREETRTTSGMTVIYTQVYTYEGDGEWTLLLETSNAGHRHNYGGLAKMTKKCTSENEGAKEKLVYGIEPDVITLYYQCANGEWTEISEADYHCTTEKTVAGDTCSFESGDSTLHYMFMYVGYYQNESYHKNIWVESTVDPEFGYCPQAYTEPTYIQKDGKFYYCNGGKWQTAGFVPRQETDSRKEGLTDEEYDILDLPKEAKVGDRVGGLLENCFDNVELDLGGPDEWHFETYDYCLSKNYYRYRENGVWTLETEDDLENESSLDCVPGTENAEYSYLPKSREPGRVYKRSDIQRNTITEPNGTAKEEYYCEDVLVEYIFGRFEKK